MSVGRNGRVYLIIFFCSKVVQKGKKERKKEMEGGSE